MNINDLKNKHSGQECIILACGPSINEFSTEKLREICVGKIVFAVKQAYNLVPDIVDYHFYNSANIVPYWYPAKPDSRPVVISQFASNEINYWNTRKEFTWDLQFIVDSNTDFSQALVSTLDFDRWTLDNSGEIRCWGPGTMYESVFYTAAYMGFSKIYTIGWDMGPPGSTTREHFYGSNTNTLNPANPLEVRESALEVAASEHFNKWLKSQGIDLLIASENSYVHSSIKRVVL